MKERLTGAAILVGLAVLLVPELLSGPKDPQVLPPAVNETGPVRTFIIDLNAPGQTAAALEPPAPPAKPLPTPEPAEQLPATPPKPEQKPETKPEIKPEPQPQPQPKPREERKPHQTIPERTQKPRVVSATTSGWAVQLGSFANSDNAKRLANEVKAQGYKVFIDTTGSGSATRHRVRVGPEPTRAQAEQLASRLKSAGRQVAIVTHP